MVCKIVPIEKPDLKKLNKVDISHKFLYKSIKDEISLYEYDQIEGVFVYSYFEFYFLVTQKNTKEEASKTRIIEFKKIDDAQPCFAHHFFTLQTNEDVSQSLRGSKTLTISENNCYDNADIKVVFSENGFLLCNKIGFGTNSFERVLLLFLLALAYNIKTERLLQNISEAYKNDSYDEMIKIKNEIYSFDLNCFFYNPVKQDRHQVYAIWNLISENYDVKIKHDEIKSQVEDLVGIIESKYKDNLEKREKNRTWLLGIFGTVISLASLVSAFKDEIKTLLGF